jgi:thiol-disulfide isomerase/thioredoxin
LTVVLLAVVLAAPSPPPPAEARVVEYLEAHVEPGRPVVVSDLYGTVFTTPEERAALGRLFKAFFKLPLFVAQYRKAAGRPPTLAEIEEQFHFDVPGEARVLLSIMEADPRMPRFLTCDPKTGEITSVDVAAIFADPRFGRPVERSLGGFEGKEAPAFATTAARGRPLRSSDLGGMPYLLYFWFSGCPPCVRTAPKLAALDRTYSAKGLRIVGLNADRALELPYTDADRKAYAAAHGLSFTQAEATPEVLEAFGAIAVFPTIFAVNARGTVVRELVGEPDEAALDGAARLALAGGGGGGDGSGGGRGAEPAGDPDGAVHRSEEPGRSDEVGDRQEHAARRLP